MASKLSLEVEDFLVRLSARIAEGEDILGRCRTVTQQPRNAEIKCIALMIIEATRHWR
jgi:hypothetical protein